MTSPETPPPNELSFRRLRFPDLYEALQVDRDVSPTELDQLGEPANSLEVASIAFLQNPWLREAYDEVLRTKPSLADRTRFDRVARLQAKHRDYDITLRSAPLTDMRDAQIFGGATLLELQETVDLDDLASLIYHLQAPATNHNTDLTNALFSTVVFYKPLGHPDGFAFNTVQSLWTSSEGDPALRAFGTSTVREASRASGDQRMSGSDYLLRVGSLAALAGRHVRYGDLQPTDSAIPPTPGITASRRPPSMAIEAAADLSYIERAIKGFQQDDADPVTRAWSESWMTVITAVDTFWKQTTSQERLRAKQWSQSRFPSTTPAFDPSDSPLRYQETGPSRRVEQLAITTIHNAVAARTTYLDAIEAAPFVPATELARLSDLMVETHDRADLANGNRLLQARMEAGTLGVER